MPHDRFGNLLQVGDRVALFGTVTAITSDQETYCNISFQSEERMAPDAEYPYDLSLSARMVEKVTQDQGDTPARKVLGCRGDFLRGLASPGAALGGFAKNAIAEVEKTRTTEPVDPPDFSEPK